MALHQLLNSFTGGEVTPFLDARLDLAKYISSLRTMENFRPLPYGGATFRPPTTVLNEVKNSNKKGRMISFTFSTTVVYQLEFAESAIRFYRNRVRLGAPYEVATPYLEADIPQLQFRQINSVMYITHPSYPQKKLSCFGDTSWTFTDISWTYPALLDQNIDSTLTITPSGATGAITLTASSALFNSLLVGAYFELAYKRDGSNITLDISTNAGTVDSSTIRVKGDWSIVTANYWYGTLRVQRSLDNGSTWETIREFVSKADRNANGSGTELTDCLLRMEWVPAGNPFATPDPWTGTAPVNYVKAQAKLETSQVFVAGVVQVTAYTDTTHVSASVITATPGLPATTATAYWSEGAWSPYRGYPRAVGLFEQRILYAGTTYKPNTVWGSVSADFENFAYGDTDDSALAFQIADAEQNPVQWLAPLSKIHVGTTGAEHAMSSANTDEPLTPNNVTIRTQSSYGSESIVALKIDNGIVFVQRQGRRLRELRDASPYGNPADFVCPDLTLYAEHITTGGITQMAFARLPDPLIYAIRADGQMPVMTYNREQNILAWARYVTAGLFESVSSSYGSPTDDVYVIVKRTINGVTKRFVEVFEADSVDKINMGYVDCAYRITGAASNTKTAAHLPNTAVKVVADGVAYDLTTDGSGVATLPNGGTASVWNIGLAYTGTLLPMKIDSMLANGTSQGRQRNISEICIRFKDALGIKFGYSLSQLDEVDFRQRADNMDQTPPLFTGDVSLPWNGIHDQSSDVYIYQDQPFQATVLALIPILEYLGK